MLGGRSSFGAGGWDRDRGRPRPAGDRSAATTRRSSPRRASRFTPNPRGLDNYMLQIGPDPRGEPRLWTAHAAALRGQPPRRRSSRTPRSSASSRGPRPSRSWSARRSAAVACSPSAARPGSGPAPRTRPAGAPEVLEAGHLLARPQGRQGGERGQAQARRPPDRRSARSSTSASPPTTPRAPRSPGLKFETRVTLEGDPKAKYSEPGRRVQEGRRVARELRRRPGPPGRLPRHGRGDPRRQGARPRQRPVHRLPGRPRAGEPRRRPRASSARSPRPPAASSSPPSSCPSTSSRSAASSSPRCTARPSARSGTTGPSSCSSRPC